MSKKNSNVILKEGFKSHEELSLIYRSLKKKLDYSKKKKFVVGVSGGPDSLALTALTKAYSLEKKCKIYYVLVDHNLRKNSSKEASQVKNLLKKHEISLKILTNKRVINKNVQSQAREIRYDLLVKFCKKNKLNNILTAHNLEDQVETFFIRLSRGSGLDGLSSMKQIYNINSKISLSRPLLDVNKIQLKKISKIIFGKYFKDPTNNNKKYLRTRVRNLKKSLESSGINYNQIIKSINNLASSRETLNFYFNKIYNEITQKDKKNIVIKIEKFKKLNKEMQMRVIKKSLKELTKSYYLQRAKKINYLIAQILTKERLNYNLAGCLIMVEKNNIILMKKIKS